MQSNLKYLTKIILRACFFPISGLQTFVSNSIFMLICQFFFRFDVLAKLLFSAAFKRKLSVLFKFVVEMGFQLIVLSDQNKNLCYSA